VRTVGSTGRGSTLQTSKRRSPASGQNRLTLSARVDPETGDYLLRVGRLDSAQLPDLVSDFLSNVRPPLDHLVYALALGDDSIPG